MRYSEITVKSTFVELTLATPILKKHASVKQ